MSRTFVECAFVNGNPVGYGKDFGYLVTAQKHENDNGETLILSVVRDVIYPHPDAKMEAVLHVKEHVIVCRAEKNDDNYPILYMMLQCQKLAAKIAVKV